MKVRPEEVASAGAVRVMRLRPILVLAAAMLLFAAACSNAASPEGDESFLSEGDPAPNFTLPSANGERVALGDLTNHKPVLLYFSMGPG
jgi:cytochrome oxidase Cu insertion factor (SCO1/SenC/PrrC family)